jgi:Protein of unknown function (DUF3309)
MTGSYKPDVELPTALQGCTRSKATCWRANMLGTILLIILIILLIGALPTWPYSGAWGYYPSSGLGLLLIIVIILLVIGRI